MEKKKKKPSAITGWEVLKKLVEINRMRRQFRQENLIKFITSKKVGIAFEIINPDSMTEGERGMLMDLTRGNRLDLQQITDKLAETVNQDVPSVQIENFLHKAHTAMRAEIIVKTPSAKQRGWVAGSMAVITRDQQAQATSQLMCGMEPWIDGQKDN